MRAVRLSILLVAVLTTLGWAQRTPIDAARSTLTINVYKSGLFSAFGDNHLVRAPIARGEIVTDGQRSVTLAVDTAQMKVLDPKASADDRVKVQEKMLGDDVLAPRRFPEITFASTSIEPRGAGKWTVRGNLALHGTTRGLTFDVVEANGHYTGKAKIKQTDFGIDPPGIPGGLVKAKDEVEIVWDIVPAH